MGHIDLPWFCSGVLVQLGLSVNGLVLVKSNFVLVQLGQLFGVGGHFWATLGSASVSVTSPKPCLS